MIVLKGNSDGLRVIRRKLRKKKKKKREREIERKRERMRGGGKRDKRRAGEGRKGRLESRDCQRRETEQRYRGIEKPQREKGKKRKE